MSSKEKLENQLAQFTATVPVANSKQVLGQPETFVEYVNVVSTRFGKPQCQESHDHAIDAPFIAKKENPGYPTITCSIGPHDFHNAFCDLGASINIMSKVMFDKVLGGPLSPANFQLQMVDRSLRKPEGVAKDILVKVRDTYIPTDFVILDMCPAKKDPIILGRPFLNTTNATMHMGSGKISFHMQGQTMNCKFNGFNMHRYSKNKQPKKTPHKSVEQA